MIKLFLFLLGVFSALTHPLSSCDEELKRMDSCQEEMIGDNIQVFSRRSFKVNIESANKYILCVCDVKCPVAVQRLAFFNNKMKLFKKMDAIYPCISHHTYHAAKNECDGAIAKNCDYQEFFGCMQNELKKNSLCKDAKIIKFMELEPDFHSYCVSSENLKTLRN